MKPILIISLRRSKFPLRSQRWRWVATAENGNVLAISSEGYANQRECLEMAGRVCNGGYEIRVAP